MPNDNTDLVMWLQELANMGLDYIIGFIQANTRRIPDSLPVGILFLIFVCLYCLLPYTNLLLLNVGVMYSLDWTIIYFLFYLLNDGQET